jgi:drug/metabolite transporter (DMT)-like permease
VFAWFLLDEVLSVTQIVGGLVLLAGVILAETARTARRDAPVVPELPTG